MYVYTYHTYMHTHHVNPDGDKNLNLHAMVQYYFKGPVIPVMVKPQEILLGVNPFFARVKLLKMKFDNLLPHTHHHRQLMS